MSMTLRLALRITPYSRINQSIRIRFLTHCQLQLSAISRSRSIYRSNVTSCGLVACIVSWSDYGGCRTPSGFGVGVQASQLSITVDLSPKNMLATIRFTTYMFDDRKAKESQRELKEAKMS